MAGTRILLLDLAPSTGLGETLASLLGDFRLELCRPPAPRADAVFDLRDLEGLLRQENARAAFLSLPDPPALAGSLNGRAAPAAPVFAVTPAEDPAALLDLLHLGLTDFIRSPSSRGDVLPRLWRSLEHRRRKKRFTLRIKEDVALKRLIGESPAFLAETRKLPLLARCDIGVLVCGETGTGKEVVARTIHHLSPRAVGPFIPVNCGAIPVELVENELFGHARGAFTGAMAARPGLIEEASHGTLLLDEIDCLPPLAQTKLLRFLQEKEFRALGSNRVRHGDVRVIAATNTDVETAVAKGQLRRDLFYRLNVVPVNLPPLRERREDIAPLARHFLRRFAGHLERRVDDFTPEAMEALSEHGWPGNVRELENVVQRAVVLCESGSRIRLEDTLLANAGDDGKLSFQEAKARVVARFERRYLEKMLAAHSGNISHAARAAKKNRRAFWELMRKHDIQAERFR